MNGWGMLGQALAGPNTEQAYQKGQLNAARLGGLLADAQMKVDERLKREEIEASALRAGIPAGHAALLATSLRAGFDPTKISGYTGAMQEQGFRGDAVARALAGDWDASNANLMGVANGPQALASVDGQNLINNRFKEGGGGISTTEQGRAGMAADAARAAASYASANSSNASADSTRQRLGIAQAQFDLQRQGQWNPGGKPAGGAGAGGAGAKPLPVGALKELLGVEEALGGTQVLNDIIQKNAQRLADGSLKVGPVALLTAKTRTAMGMATDADVALNEWNADVTKIVNESLRLNKGVQTEGDAQRAAQELMNASDQRTVASALQRLAAFNRRAVELHSQKANLINSNYGRPTTGPDLGAALGVQPAAASDARRSLLDKY